MIDFDRLTVTVADGIGTVTFDEPSNRNALDLGIADELVAAAAALGDDPEVRCIVLTHAGDFFGTGADLTQFEGEASDAVLLRRLAGRIHEAVIQFHQGETPVVGGVDGIAAGVGFSLTLVPDLLLLSEEARLEYAYPRIGLTGDGGATFFLPRLVGLRAAKEIVLLDEPIGAERARDLGLATEVVAADAFDARLDDVAGQIASGPTAALGPASALLTESFDRSLAAQLAAETDAIAAAAHTTDFQRGFEAFFGDGDPDFVGY
ncbi:MAG: enoyl-CoA hydratase-related protein [Haloarculaceae archaeon]